MKPKPVVVAIDADKGTRRLLRQILEPGGYRVFEAESVQKGLEAVRQRRPDVVILELELAEQAQAVRSRRKALSTGLKPRC